MFEHGELAVKFARAAIDAEVKGCADFPLLTEVFEEPCGVVVSLSTFPDGCDRGSVGYPEAVYPLSYSLENASMGVCHDLKFSDLEECELENVCVQVTFLTEPVLLDVPKNKVHEQIEIGRHGLMLISGKDRAVLLPNSPIEWNWDIDEYLKHLSIKAGLPKDGWKFYDTQLFVFETVSFKEKEPHGNIIRC